MNISYWEAWPPSWSVPAMSSLCMGKGRETVIQPSYGVNSGLLVKVILRSESPHGKRLTVEPQSGQVTRNIFIATVIL